MPKKSLKFDWSETKKKMKTEKENSKKGDERFWNLKREKGTEEGTALIRFLPDADKIPYVMLFHHFVKYISEEGSESIYAGTCLTSIGKDCPICNLNKRYWNSGHESDKEIARGRKRKKTYISNILVIDDKGNPENNGKVFLFSYGATIFEKIENQVFPKNDFDEPITVWDFYEGANFILQSTKKDGYVNYDNSKFTKVGPIAKTDEEIEAIWNKTVSLSEFIDETKMDNYEQIKEKLSGIFTKVGSSIPKVDEFMEAKTVSVDSLEDSLEEGTESDIPF